MFVLTLRGGRWLKMFHNLLALNSRAAIAIYFDKNQLISVYSINSNFQTWCVQGSRPKNACRFSRWRPSVLHVMSVKSANSDDCEQSGKFTFPGIFCLSSYLRFSVSKETRAGLLYSTCLEGDLEFIHRPACQLQFKTRACLVVTTMVRQKWPTKRKAHRVVNTRALSLACSAALPS